MKQKLRLLIYFVLASSYSGFSQVDYLSDDSEGETLSCSERVIIAENYFRGYDTIPKNIDKDKGFEYLLPCLRENSSEAQHLYGLLHIGAYKAVPRNYTIGFEYIEKAAQQGNADALCNLAILYKRGKGCDIDFDKSIETHEEAFALGNTKSAYKLGYMYFKGLGSIDQDYEKAVEWFTKSEYPFSSFFLGVCYYYGYGVAQDKAKALDIVGSCTLPGCQRLYESLSTDNHVILNEEEIDSSEEIKKDIEQTEEVIEAEVDEEEFEISDISGNWEGKLVEFDWSNSKIVRTMPIAVSAKVSKNTITDFTFTLSEKTQNDVPVVLDNNLSFSDLNMNLERLYKDALGYDYLDYKINSMSAISKRALGIDYLVFNIDSYVVNWKEPGPPMQLILKKKIDVESSRDEEISNDLINFLVEDNEEFIQLYPNPFVTNLLIEYELEETSTVFVEVYNYLDQSRTVLEAGKLQEPQKYTYNLNGHNLKDGLYIVRVTANDQVHSQFILKGN